MSLNQDGIVREQRMVRNMSERLVRGREISDRMSAKLGAAQAFSFKLEEK